MRHLLDDPTTRAMGWRGIIAKHPCAAEAWGRRRIVSSGRLNPEEKRDLVMRAWMTHDALWYGEVAARFGMGEASPMNLRVCRKLGRTEFSRLMKAAQASPPRDMAQFMSLFQLGQEVFVPPFIRMTMEELEDGLAFHVVDCFAHRGMERAGVLDQYECGIFERMQGWFDATGLKYTVTPDLGRCLKFRGQECRVTVRFDFS
jgi:hypothetical protein